MIPSPSPGISLYPANPPSWTRLLRLAVSVCPRVLGFILSIVLVSFILNDWYIFICLSFLNDTTNAVKGFQNYLFLSIQMLTQQSLNN